MRAKWLVRDPGKSVRGLQYRSSFLSSLLIGSLRSLTSYSAYLGYRVYYGRLGCGLYCYIANRIEALKTTPG